MYSTAGGYADVIAFRGGRYISTFTFPNISAALLNNTLLSCLDIRGDENNETIYLAGTVLCTLGDYFVWVLMFDISADWPKNAKFFT